MDYSTIKFKNKQREKQRQENLEKPREEKPARKKNPMNEPWCVLAIYSNPTDTYCFPRSKQKMRVAKKLERQEKKLKERAHRGKEGEVDVKAKPEKHAAYDDDHHDKNNNDDDDIDDMEEETRLAKRMKKGKMSKAEFDAMFHERIAKLEAKIH